MATLLYKLGRSAFRRRGRFLAGWLLLLALVGGGLAAFGSHLDSEATIPGSQSQKGIDILEKSLPSSTGVTAQIVFVAPRGSTVDDARYRSVIEKTVETAGGAPQVETAVDPFEAESVSADRRTAMAQVMYPVKRDALRDTSVEELERIAFDARSSGLEAEVGGTIYSTAGLEVGIGEVIGLAVAVVVLLVTFGSLLAAGLPLLTALLGLVVGLAGLLLVSNIATVSSTAPSLALMIGLAVGIDYALLILSRHRTQLASGMDPEESAGRATGTAGSAVVFAGLTVIVALCGLTVVGIPFLSVMGLAAAGTVLLSVLVAVTLLPALLGFAGARLRPRSGSRTDRRERATQDGHRRTGGERWARLVTRRPLVTVVAVVVGLAVMALPAAQLSLAMPDNGTAAPESTQRKAYDLISDAFGPGRNGRLLVLVQTDGADPGAAAGTVARGIDDLGLPEVLSVSAPQTATDGRTAIVTVVPKAGPRADETVGLVRDIRAATPALADRTDSDVLVTGSTAAAIDVSDRLKDSLLPFAVIVVGLALLLLLLVFRSIVVPLKAAFGFLLSVAASFGAVVAVFQWGWLADQIGVPTTGPVFSFMPIVLMAVLFGLAMDYEVFLVSRMREEYVHTGRHGASVISGARHASRVVTAAALIMFAVFASFVTAEDLTLKPIALGLAVGILVDAVVVRMTLVPAILALVGERSWWLPRWLDRMLPDLDMEGAELSAPTRPEDSGAVPGPSRQRRRDVPDNHLI
ncbi:MMPL family transporter [Streptomyces olivaceus]|uniref:MMPL family transporter n=1 Tax=Streptomyces olivaceus TaxID=47716 RepID=UPI001CCDA4D4|nr:MMPL family transporter [Streptomyces olivaceus]MBZ6172631.1 MMPL family transporter [Streptomyces olivaceus]MBZ6179394.1 MMPL family transporter [Streptomyces olivaceus]